MVNDSHAICELPQDGALAAGDWKLAARRIDAVKCSIFGFVGLAEKRDAANHIIHAHLTACPPMQPRATRFTPKLTTQI